ncbi:MAG TPA: sugar phosphate isomerase/epimerase [Puia sp.]|jgi:sugar phosphate isomerase/epimerase
MGTRRKFLQAAGLLAVGLGDRSGLKGVAASRLAGAAGSDAAIPTVLNLGLAGYTFLHIPMDQGISMMKRLGIDAFSIKDFWLPLGSNAEKVKETVGTFTAAGIRIYGAGVIYMKSQEEVDRAFAYAKLLGIELIIGVPNPELIGYMEQKVKETGIRVAVHNHGPEDKLYPSPADVWSHIKGLDERIGLCLDIGHAARAGADPVKAVHEYGTRIFDMHFKDLATLTKEYHPAVLGRGVLDIPGLMRALKKIKYKGYCSLEFEMDMKDPYPGIAESVGYFRGVGNCI